MMKREQTFRKLCAVFLCMVLFLSLIPAGFADSKEDYSIAEPELISLEKTGNSLTLSWKAVDGVNRYSVHRKLDGSSWETIALVNDTTYSDNNIGGATDYTYTVRCINEMDQYLSWYDEAGLTVNIPWACATPSVSGTASNNAVIINWNAIGGAAKYSVHRKVSGGNWNTIAEVSGTSYTDTSITVGTEYTYTVRCLDANGKYASAYEEGVTLTPAEGAWEHEAPVLGTPKFTGSGIQITWNAVDGVKNYSVHRKVNGGNWSTIAENVNGTSYFDSNVHEGNEYVYAVRCRGTGAQYYSSGYNETSPITADGSSVEWPLAEPSAPSLNSENGGVRVTWDPVPGANRYSIHRRVNGGNWYTIGYSDSNTYVDRDVKSGNAYTYTVRCVNGSGQYMSSYNEGSSITFFRCSAPEFKVTQVEGGIKISWNTVEGASFYSVHRKIDGGEWNTIADAVWGTEYVDTALVPGTTYTYTVRCRGGGDQPYYISWYREGKESYSIYYYGKASVTGLENSSGVEETTYNGFTFETKAGLITIKWTAMPGVSGYRILRKANDGTIWKNIATVPGDQTTYDDYSVASNNTYTYTVRGVNASGDFVGDYDSKGRSVRYYDAPQILDVTREANGLMITWNPIIGIQNYQVYRQVKDDIVGKVNTWKLIGSTQDLYFVDHNVEKGVSYYYGVRCVNQEGTTVVSGMMSTTTAASWEVPVGGSYTYRVDWLNTPVLKDVVLDGNAAVFKWRPVDGASRYQVIRRTDNTSWQKLAIVNDVAGDTTEYVRYADNKRVSGTRYYYSVYCLDASGNQISNYDPDGVYLSYYEMAPLLKIENRYNGVYLNWEVVDNTATYQIYRKVGDNVWEKIGTSATTNYTDTTAINGITYCYSVSSMDVSNTQLNDYYQGGFTVPWNNKITFYNAPRLISIANANGGVEIKWDDVDRIYKYKVYRKVPGGDWELVTPAPQTVRSFIDVSAQSGKTYIYSVRCCDMAGTVVSALNPDGLTIYYLATPQPVKATAAKDGITVQWTASAGTDGYHIYRRLPGGGWKWLKWVGSDTVTYKDNDGLVHGQTYEYTVRASKGDWISWYVEPGISVKAK